MIVRLKLKEGQKGKKQLTQEYGEQLCAVRYRYDETTQKRYKTIEIIIDESEWRPPAFSQQAV